MIDGLTNSDAIPTLERMMQFAGQRHRILTNNIANLSTPGFHPVDVSVEGFQQQLAEAVDARRAAHPDGGGELRLSATRQVQAEPDRLVLAPEPAGENLLFHDGNDRNLERAMQGLVENFLVFRTAAQFLQSQFDLLKTAIRERM